MSCMTGEYDSIVYFPKCGAQRPDPMSSMPQGNWMKLQFRILKDYLVKATVSYLPPEAPGNITECQDSQVI